MTICECAPGCPVALRSHAYPHGVSVQSVWCCTYPQQDCCRTAAGLRNTQPRLCEGCPGGIVYPRVSCNRCRNMYSTCPAEAFIFSAIAFPIFVMPRGGTPSILLLPAPIGANRAWPSTTVGHVMASEVSLICRLNVFAGRACPCRGPGQLLPPSPSLPRA